MAKFDLYPQQSPHVSLICVWLSSLDSKAQHVWWNRATCFLKMKVVVQSSLHEFTSSGVFWEQDKLANIDCLDNGADAETSLWDLWKVWSNT